MADVTAINSYKGGVRFAVWSGMAGGDAGIGLNKFFNFSTRVVQSYYGAGGQFGTSSVFFEGSNNSTDGLDGNWSHLTDAQGNNINLGVNSGHIEAVVENTFFIRPRVGTGTGSLVAVHLFGVR